MKRTLGAILAAAALAAPVHAQQAGTVTVGAFGDFVFLDRGTPLTELPAPGVGGFLGLFVLPNLAIEGGVSYNDAHIPPTDKDSGWVPFRARLVYNFPVTETFYPMIGVGYAYQKYTGVLADETDNAITGLIGFKNYFTDKLALRADLQVNYAAAPFNEAVRDVDHTNVSLGIGLSYDIFKGRVGDMDGDGVSDRMDACGGTPAGVMVDERGCRIDSDGDGVWDEDDQCPDTPAGVRVSPTGCRVDSDGDGVWDEDDRCPNTPAGVEVTGEGCPVDSDGDGVADAQDQCPGTAEGITVNASGCPVDSDNDGVPDSLDRCPATPEGAAVDENGCEDLFAEGPDIFLEGVNFETGTAELTDASFAVLNEVAASLMDHPEERVRVVGHTDNTGNREINLQLSAERAQAVVDYLVSRGVAGDRLESAGVGPDEPVASNDTEEGRALNRRVELVLISR